MPPWMQEPADDALYAEPAAHAPPAALSGEELAALQLAARGYALEQIAQLLGEADGRGVAAMLRRAAEKLGAGDAVVEADARGLIL